MPVTRQEVLDAGYNGRYHEEHKPAGKIYEWRANGRCQTWKTMPNRFSQPVKYGIRSYGYITQDNMNNFHLASKCPTRHVRVELPEGNGNWFGIVTGEDADRKLTLVQVTTRGKSPYRVGSDVWIKTEDVKDI
jgi:hypothetical protein